MKTLYGSDKLTASAQNRESFQILPVFFSLKNFDREKSYVLMIGGKKWRPGFLKTVKCFCHVNLKNT